VTLDVLALLGDAVWIFVMATMASANRRAGKAIPAGVRLPMQWRQDRKPTWRAAKPLAFGLTLGVPLVVGLALSAAARAPDLDAGEPLILFLVRMATAPLVALAHMLWLRAALRTLDAEGALKP
jgi:hypothetical protein